MFMKAQQQQQQQQQQPGGGAPQNNHLLLGGSALGAMSMATNLGNLTNSLQGAAFGGNGGPGFQQQTTVSGVSNTALVGASAPPSGPQQFGASTSSASTCNILKMNN